MKVIIPVAGIGTRLRPHTYSIPKPLLYVAGKRVLDHVLEPIVELAPEEIIFVVGYLGDQIKDYVERNFSFKTRFIYQKELLGLGFAVDLALKEVDSGPVLVILGDTIVKCDLKKFVGRGDNVLGLMPVDDPKRFGIAKIRDNRVISLVEKPENPESNLAVIGLYYFKDALKLKEALGGHIATGKKTRGEIQFTDALELMIEAGVVFAPFEVDQWLDCGKKETLLDTNRRLLPETGNSPRIAGSLVVPPVFIDPDVKIINSVIGPYVSIAKGTKIENSIIKSSIIAENTSIENAVLEDSLIGNKVTVSEDKKSLNISVSSEVDLPDIKN